MSISTGSSSTGSSTSGSTGGRGTITPGDRSGVVRLQERLKSVGQEHLLNFLPELDPASAASLLSEVGALDLGSLPALINTYVHSKETFRLPPDLRPAPFFPNDPDRRGDGLTPWDPAAARRAGENLLRQGKVACFTVAGGQGSRLGFEGPKGCYPAGAVTNKPLFQVFAEGVKAAAITYGAPVRWYIMTSPLNHEATVAFFKEHKHFGLDPALVRFFPQGVLPSLDIKTGKVLLASKGQLATNPDGHGGSIKALHVSGSLDDMHKAGIEQLSYFQVDNPLVKVVDPVFLGLHAAGQDSSAEMSSKMIAKASAEEKVGVFCAAGPGRGTVQVVEYSDLPVELSRQTNPDGSLRFIAGSIAVHIMSVAFITRLAESDRSGTGLLPYHRAEKKVPCIDPATGAPVTPTANNAVKLERFVFDALPMCKSSVVYQTERTEEFAPIKNATGADSPDTCRALQTERAARWLSSAGVKIPRKPDGSPDCVLEISPLTASEPAQLRGKPLPSTIERGARLAL